MTKERYVQQTKRRAQLRRLVEKNPEISVSQAADKLDISVTRVYQLCKAEGIVLRCLAKWINKDSEEG